MSESIRKQLILKLLGEGKHSIKEISERADCTTGYVYNIRTEWMLEQKKRGAPAMRLLNEQIDQAIEPKPFSHDWQPKWWQMVLMSAAGAAIIYIFLVLGLSI